MKSPIRTITIPQYIQYVQLSKKRRAKYYLKSSKKPLPKKYKGLKYNRKGILVHSDGVPVIANPRSVGTPKMKKINGQEIYSGMPHHMRSKIVREIKSSFQPYLRKVKPIENFPIIVEMELHTVIGEGGWDLDNLWIYNKCFQDSMVDAGILPDDHICYITKPASPMLYPVDTPEERKMVFKIYKDTRKAIKNNPYFKVPVHEDF